MNAPSQYVRCRFTMPDSTVREMTMLGRFVLVGRVWSGHYNPAKRGTWVPIGKRGSYTRRTAADAEASRLAEAQGLYDEVRVIEAEVIDRAEQSQ